MPADKTVSGVRICKAAGAFSWNAKLLKFKALIALCFIIVAMLDLEQLVHHPVTGNFPGYHSSARTSKPFCLHGDTL